LWNLPEEARIYTGNFTLPTISDARRDHLEACPWDSLELSLLADELELIEEISIAARLRGYLYQRKDDITSPARDLMDLMACKLFQAINRGLQLRLGYPLAKRLKCVLAARAQDNFVVPIIVLGDDHRVVNGGLLSQGTTAMRFESRNLTAIVKLSRNA
jgi:hypothetical protein